ncbi:hypothetical protein CYMTET_51023 [Cymbomonas tetramitiformis]|uniref:RING-type domain-containing protein n=1 Tax=Cymbomonas tetramitiformis TaxID=36881 RepID=A0AAE0EU60_9CHLO|nr:hypothetical protein CYMTET_51023 [Cymbomonas tetramitiformis]
MTTFLSPFPTTGAAIQDVHDRLTGYADGAFSYTSERQDLLDLIKCWYDTLCSNASGDGVQYPCGVPCREALLLGAPLCAACESSLDAPRLLKAVQAAVNSWHGKNACVVRVGLDPRRFLFELAQNLLLNGLLQGRDDLQEARELSEREQERAAEARPLDEKDLPIVQQAPSGWEGMCVICLDSIGGEAEIRVQSCGHAFHSECLGSWAQKKTTEGLPCPTCKRLHDPTSVSTKPHASSS